MTKLTTERLETIATWRETYGNGANVMIPAEEAELMARQLLAYEQAAKKAIGSFHISGGQVEATTDYCRDGEWPVQDGEVLVYAAPVLPKQPELVERVTAEQMQAVCMEATRHIGKYAAMAKEVNKLLGRKPAPAQPAIPDEITSASAPEVFEIAAEAERLGIRGTYGSYAVGWNACRAEMLKAQQNEPQNIPAQPVIPERPELRYGDNVLWFLNELAAFDASDIDSDDFDVYGEDRNGMEGCATISITELAADAAKLLSAQPVSEPYKFKDAVEDIRNLGVEIDADKIKAERDALNSPAIPDAYVLDELGRMTLNGVCEPRVSFGAGWNACRAAMLKAQQNEPQNIPENIPAQPVSNPYKFLDERAKYRVIIEGFSNSRSVDFEACSQEEAEEIGRDIFHEECNYGVERLESIPAQESE